MPEELTGYMRLAQDKVKVQVIGNKEVGEFTSDEKSRKPELKHLSAYIVIHEQDAAVLVKARKELEILKKENKEKEK